MMPRYGQNDQSGYNPPPTSQSSMHSSGSIYGGQSGMAQQQRGYQRQYSEPTMSSGYSEFNSNQFDSMQPPKQSAARPITNKHLRNE